MKIRSIHPEFFSDSRLCRLPYEARILFAGLWCFADDFGRGEWIPKKIEGAIFPRDEVDIEKLLGMLLEGRFLTLFTDGDDEFYELPKWETYQSPKYRAKTQIPDPESLENPYVVRPGNFGANSGEMLPDIVQESVPGEGEERERRGRGRGSIALRAETGRPRDVIWDTLVELLGEPSPSKASLWGKQVKWIKEQGGTPDDVRRVAMAIVAEWGPQALTINSIVDYWHRYDAAVGKTSQQDVEQYHAEMQRQRRLAELEAIDNEKRLES